MRPHFMTLLIVVIIIVGLLEVYTFYGLKTRWNKSSHNWAITLKILYFSFLTLSLLSIVAMAFFSDYFPKYFRNFLFAFVMINVFTKLVFAFFLGIDDARRLLIWIKSLISSAPTFSAHGISRSDFLVKSGLIAAAVPAISYPLGMIFGPYNYKVFNTKVKLSHLPKEFNGLKIVQISDIHSGSFYDKEAVNRGIDLILEQKADIIFFTGDLVNDSADEMDNYLDIFSRLQAPLGVFSILGNHDYGDYTTWKSEEAKVENFNQLKEIHSKLGWRLLLDEHIYIEREESKIALIGVENWGKGFHQIGDLAKAYKGVDAPIKLLLSHDPTHWDEEVKTMYKDIDITFSGHTHGAQMGIETHGFKWSPISLRYKNWAGLYQEGNQYLYINRGYGFLGYPGRVGIMPEITVMTLEV